MRLGEVLVVLALVGMSIGFYRFFNPPPTKEQTVVCALAAPIYVRNATALYVENDFVVIETKDAKSFVKVPYGGGCSIFDGPPQMPQPKPEPTI